MLEYQQLTLEQVVKQVLLRVSAFVESTNLDIPTVVMLVNQARREVVAKTLPFKDWAYIKTVSVAHLDELNDRYMKHVRLTCNNGTRYVEARYIDPREWFTLTNAELSHSWNKASNTAPVFTVWGHDTYDRGLQIHIHPALPSELDFYCAPPDLTVANLTATLGVPYEFENTIISATVVRALAKLGATNQLIEAQQKSMQEQVRIRQIYSQKMLTEKLNIESYADSPSGEQAIAQTQQGAAQ